jgi:hypothetical protein
MHNICSKHTIQEISIFSPLFFRDILGGYGHFFEWMDLFSANGISHSQMKQSMRHSYQKTWQFPLQMKQSMRHSYQKTWQFPCFVLCGMLSSNKPAFMIDNNTFSENKKGVNEEEENSKDDQDTAIHLTTATNPTSADLEGVALEQCTLLRLASSSHYMMIHCLWVVFHDTNKHKKMASSSFSLFFPHTHHDFESTSRMPPTCLLY